METYINTIKDFRALRTWRNNLNINGNSVDGEYDHKGYSYSANGFLWRIIQHDHVTGGVYYEHYINEQTSFFFRKLGDMELVVWTLSRLWDEPFSLMKQRHEARGDQQVFFENEPIPF